MEVAVVQERMSGLPTIWMSMLSAPLLYAGIVLFMLPIAFLGAPQAWSFTLFAVALVALLLNPFWTLEEAA